MTPEERRAFLREPARPAMLATVRPDVAPLWIVVDERDPRVAPCGEYTSD